MHSYLIFSSGRELVLSFPSLSSPLLSSPSLSFPLLPFSVSPRLFFDLFPSLFIFRFPSRSLFSLRFFLPFHTPRYLLFLFSPRGFPFFSRPLVPFVLRSLYSSLLSAFFFFIFWFCFLHRVGIFFSLLLSCYKSSTKKLARSRFLGFQEKVKVATLYCIVLQFYLFFLKAKKLLAKGNSTLPSPLFQERV